ncbi:hypothetical protein Syun_012972 [Stephania yunnanensis]|uniref:Uncharacterized protein n=1 Tax=Stephania yunnanensis TaxID=152371 RepID=A0AAP0PGW2_9MAGN
MTTTASSFSTRSSSTTAPRHSKSMVIGTDAGTSASPSSMTVEPPTFFPNPQHHSQFD